MKWFVSIELKQFCMMSKVPKKYSQKKAPFVHKLITLDRRAFLFKRSTKCIAYERQVLIYKQDKLSYLYIK